MSKKNTRGETKKLANLPRDVLYAKDTTADIEDKVAQGILNALDKLKKTSVDRRLAKLTGTSALRYRTELSYEVHFRGLTKFFKLIGDYESLLMLRDKCPANCPSMKVESLVMYVWWKYNAPSMTLLDLGGKEVYDVMGHLIKCRGDWNAPEKRKGFRTAVWCIHKAHNQTGNYIQACQDCRDMPFDEWYKGCSTHKGHPALLRSGNPAYDSVFTDCLDRIGMDRRDYLRQPTEQLLPCWVRQLRDRLLSSNSLIDLQTFTIIQVSICLFLRFDDFVDIELDHFEAKHFVFDDAGNIRALCLKVFGKSDENWVHLFLWIDEEFPEFCPVSLLLSYIHCAKIRGGFLFPTEDELKCPPANGIFVTQMSYKVGTNRLTKLVREVLGLENLKVGMHMFRRTGYLFGRWGGGAVEALMKSARHQSLKTAMLYVEDADAQLAIAHIHNNHLNKVRTFKSIFVKVTTATLVLNLPSVVFQCEISELSTRYVHDRLNVPRSHPSSFSPAHICTLAMSYVRPQNANEQLELFLNELATPRAEKLRSLINIVVHARVMKNEENRMYSNAIAATTSYQDSTKENGSTNTVYAIGITDAATIPTAPKKNRKSGSIEFDEIFEVAKTKNSHEKLELILNLARKMERLLHSDVTERMRLFDVKFIKPIIACFLNHCDSNKDTFHSLHPQFLHSKFSKGCGCSKG